MKVLIIPDGEARIPEIQAEIRKGGDSRYTHRLHAILLLAQGFSYLEVAEMLGDTSRTIINWIHRFKKDSFSGLLDGKHPGRTTRLNEEQMEQIDIALRKEPSEFGLCGPWEGKTLSKFILQTWGVTIKVRQCQRIFNKLGFRRRKPRSKIARSNPDKQEEYKKTPRD